METNHTLIPCDISPGQFDGEVAVTLHLTGGKIVTLFADKSLIQKQASGTFLKVTKIASTDKQKKEEIVVLPTEAFETGTRWLRKIGRQLAAT